MARTGIFAAAVLAAAAALLASATLPALEANLNPQSLAEAIDIGQSRINDVRARFHAPYHVVVGRPPVDYIEIVTPFRRVALDAEAHGRAGRRLYGQREALAMLGDNPSRIDVIVELTFHPQNTFIGVPDYDVSLEPAGTGPALEPMTIGRLPRFGPRLAGMLPYPYNVGPPAPGGSQPLLGGSLVATFDGHGLDPAGIYSVVINDNETSNGKVTRKALARARLDFGKLR
jgi:hypothetical protein